MKKLLLICVFLSAFSVLAQDVGRAKLTFPQGTWITISTADTAMAYGGDISGSIKAETLSLIHI
jgi:hypothetical protein